jgi:hypothetical protein
MARDCRSNTKAYRPIVLHHDGESVPAMMRLKGNWSWNCDKMQFVVSFNETDADGQFPDREPPYPVIWLVKGRSKVPWGQRIQLN